ncbi:hypothetical protein Avbf_09483 [Armadillidium vulgare]|nr:hypothetical protein Avbf_09483 [Armadillidium vulgare]
MRSQAAYSSGRCCRTGAAVSGRYQGRWLLPFQQATISCCWNWRGRPTSFMHCSFKLRQRLGPRLPSSVYKRNSLLDRSASNRALQLLTKSYRRYPLTARGNWSEFLL